MKKHDSEGELKAIFYKNGFDKPAVEYPLQLFMDVLEWGEAHKGYVQDEFVWIHGLSCPACGNSNTLFVASNSELTCSYDKCPNPDYAEARKQYVDRAVEEAVANIRFAKKVTSIKIKPSGTLSVEEVDSRIDRILCEYITCYDCGGYGIDHDRNDDMCNYSALYEKIDNAKSEILDVLAVNQSLGVWCASNRHLIGLRCDGCKKENKRPKFNTPPHNPTQLENDSQKQN